MRIPMSSIGLGFPLSMLLSVLVTILIITLSSNNMATSWTLTSSSRQTTSINRRERRIRRFSSSSRLSVSFTPFWSQNQQQKQQPTSPSSVVYDLAVIGGGVVGVQAALSAAASPFRKRVILIDAPTASGALQDANGKDLSLGGPTGLFGKALRDSSKQIKVNTLRGMGLREDSIWNEIISNCVELASSNADDVLAQLEAANVTFQQGFCTFCDSGGTDKLIVTQQPNGLQDTITTRHVLIATGSQPFRPAGIPFDGGKRVLDSDSINKLQFLPRSIAITGSGIIAVEFAKIFRNLGADVTLIIRDLIPRNALAKIGLDIDIAATLVADLIRSGIKIERGCQVGSFDVPQNSRMPMTIELREAQGSGTGGPRKSGLATTLKCDAYLAAVGRKPNTASLNLAAVGIRVDSYGGILVDSRLCTTATSGNVYAAGDVVGRPFLASTGVAQAKAAVVNMFAQDCAVVPLECDANDPSCVVGGISQAGQSFDPASLAANPFAFPTGVWSSPEAAYYGLSLQQAQKMDIDAGESMALYAECLRGRVFSPNGLLKLVFEKPAGRILGVHVCGDDACELIHYGMELIKGRRTVMDLCDSVYTAVTFHEMYKIAAQNALDEAGARKRRAAAGRAVQARQRKMSVQE